MYDVSVCVFGQCITLLGLTPMQSLDSDRWLSGWGIGGRSEYPHAMDSNELNFEAMTGSAGARTDEHQSAR
jgi:hypothetical protein